MQSLNRWAPVSAALVLPPISVWWYFAIIVSNILLITMCSNFFYWNIVDLWSISAIEQNDSVIHIQTFLKNILFHYGLYKLSTWCSNREYTCQHKRCRRLGVWSLGWEDPLEEEMATYSSILAWKSPWTGEPGKLQPKGSQSDKVEWLSTHAHWINVPVLFTLKPCCLSILSVIVYIC